MHAFSGIDGDTSARFFPADYPVTPVDTISWEADQAVRRTGPQICLSVAQDVRSSLMMLSSDVGELREKRLDIE